jgi:hypothetical protein
MSECAATRFVDDRFVGQWVEFVDGVVANFSAD